LSPYVLDTNTVVFLFKGQGRVGERLLATAPTDVALPAVVVYELGTGAALSKAPAKRRQQLATLLEAVRVIPFGRAEAAVAAQIRAELEARGEGIGPLDTLIAATAAASRGTLVTHNLREFKRVRGLALEDWY
jgi:tRNA(fMet)-specific endonuclease VapC